MTATRRARRTGRRSERAGAVVTFTSILTEFSRTMLPLCYQGSAGVQKGKGEFMKTPHLRMATLLAELSSDGARVRLSASKALRDLSEGAPELIYPHFDLFAGMLRNQNSVLRWNAIRLLGNLARVDAEGRLDRVIDEYLAPIRGPHLIDAANTMRGAAAIGAAKPHLADRIARHILKVEHADYGTPECTNVAIGHAIDALNRIYPGVTARRPVQLFASRQRENTRSATRKKAERFLRRWPMAAAGAAG
jgi:hypothetical protein